MSPSQALLRLRPTNVVGRLPAESRVCVLNPRDVFRALAGSGTVIPHFTLHLPFAIPGVLRAAREQDSVLSLSGQAGMRALAHEVQVASPYAQFDAVAEMAESAFTERPLMLSGVVPIAASDDRAIATAREVVFKFIDAGFTGLILRPEEDPPDTVARAISEMIGPVKERELTVELSMRGVPVLDRLEALAVSHRNRGVVVDGFTIVVDDSTPSSFLERIVKVFAPAGVAARGVNDVSKIPALAKAGIRRLDMSRALFDLAARHLPEGVVTEIRAQPDLGPALAAHARELDEAVSPETRERIEALAYAETIDLIQALGARGSASAVAGFLSTKSGY